MNQIHHTRNDITELIGKALLIGLLSLATAALVNWLRPLPLAWNWSPPPPVAPVITEIEEMLQIMARPETVLVDAREALFYQLGHLPGAVSLPLDKADNAALAAWRQTLSPEANIVIYCNDSLCHMADELAIKMMAQSLRPSVFLPGFEGWDMAGRPVESATAVRP